MDHKSNFSHLSEYDAALASLGTFAERYFVDDANTALIKTRQFAERLSVIVADRAGLEVPERSDFVDILRRIRMDGAAPRDVVDVLHQLRKVGNDAVHALDGERRAAFDAIRLCHRLGVWFRATATNTPGLTMAFVPPKPRPDETEALKEKIAEYEAELRKAGTEAQRLAADARAAKDAATQAEERARLAEEDRQVMEALALEIEARAAQAEPAAARAFVAAAQASGQALDLDERDTRLLVDDQLRNAGWEVDSETLRYALGGRPVKGKNRAISEWPTSSGPCDYALFIGTTLVGVVEAKRKRKNVPAALDAQSHRYARDVEADSSFQFAGGPWGEFKVPFLFAANGRGYYPQFATQSGIWYRDARRATNPARALEGWPTPEGLVERLEVDRAAAESALEKRGFDFGFELRPYQKAAIEKVEAALAEDRRKMLVAMATGTGKTKLSIAMIYRLLEAKRFLRVCFVVDRSALGEQAEGAFETTRMVGTKTFAEIFGLAGLKDKDISRDAKIHVCTVQSLVKRVLDSPPEDRPPVDQYDLIIIDECHRGYLLDREMSDAEIAFRDQDDYVSKYRRVVEYFDAVTIGLTATPALHTAQIFGDPIYRYSYREAVIDGFLIDHDPPHLIQTALSAAGITFEAGETIEALNTTTGEIDSAQLEDQLDFQVEHFNRKVLAPDFNRVVADELADHIDISLPDSGKTLVFAASDKHADEVVDYLRKAYRAQGLEIEDAAIAKITGTVDKPLDQIKKYKNEDSPKIAVTVDLLTTGVDVPKIMNLVFLRRVNSRILYDQMIGRATRLCPEIGKETFQIYDAVDLYPHLQDMTEMRPVVQNPKVTFETLFDGLDQAEDPAHQEEILDQIIVKLARKIRKMNDEIRAQYEAQAGETAEATLQRFREGAAGEARDWAKNRPGLGKFFDFDGSSNAPSIIPIYTGTDGVTGVTRGYGDGVKPEDFIDAFSAFIRDHQNEIAALQIVLTRPRDLTRDALRELRIALDAQQFTEANLRTAFRDKTNQDIAASIIGFIRQTALGDALIPFDQRVDNAIRAVGARHKLTDPQRRWLDNIGAEIKQNIVVDRAAIDEPPFAGQGGFRRLDRLFNGELETILQEVAQETWEPAA